MALHLHAFSVTSIGNLKPNISVPNGELESRELGSETMSDFVEEGSGPPKKVSGLCVDVSKRHI